MLRPGDDRPSQDPFVLSQLPVLAAAHTWASPRWSLALPFFYRSQLWNTDSPGDKVSYIPVR